MIAMLVETRPACDCASWKKKKSLQPGNEFMLRQQSAEVLTKVNGGSILRRVSEVEQRVSRQGAAGPVRDRHCARFPGIICDHQRLVQALSNLTGNALKFTPAHGRVTLRAARSGGRVCISVEDSGVGVPAEDLTHLFDRFWHGAGTSKTGAGLGLFIAKGIVEAHGGEIRAESEIGRGTAIRFTVPAVGVDEPLSR
jgi:signal transduction histidine kinase